MTISNAMLVVEVAFLPMDGRDLVKKSLTRDLDRMAKAAIQNAKHG
ncbi:hypothetical protein [Neorhizobium sp. DAR64860/K0K1]